MRRIRVPALATGFALLTACAAQPNPATDAAVTLRRADSAYTAGLQSLDVPALVTLYAPDAVMYPPGEQNVVGIDAVREFAKAFAATPGVKMTAELQTVVVSQSGDLGYVVNWVHVTRPDAHGKPMAERLRDIHVWRPDASGQWKVVVDFWNVLPAAAQ
jgi:ketosteroid isomerase-like protein